MEKYTHSYVLFVGGRAVADRQGCGAADVLSPTSTPPFPKKGPDIVVCSILYLGTLSHYLSLFLPTPSHTGHDGEEAGAETGFRGAVNRLRREREKRRPSQVRYGVGSFGRRFNDWG